MHSVAVLIVALLLGAAGCGDDADGSRATGPPIRSAEELTGVYDSNSGLVLVTGTDRNVRIDFGLLPESSISAQGTLHDDGSIELTGRAGHTDMGSSPVTGRVVVARSPTEVRIAGELRDADSRATPLEAFRPIAGTASDLGGRFAFEFTKSLSGRPITGNAVLAIEVLDDGRARLVGDADETEGSGSRLGTLSPGTCIVAAGGDFQCRARYRGAGGHPGPFGGPSEYDAVISGVLPMPEIGFTGAGRVIVTSQAPITLHAFSYTGWTAIGAPPTS